MSALKATRTKHTHYSCRPSTAVQTLVTDRSVLTTRSAIPALAQVDLEPTIADLDLVSTLAYESDDLADALADAIMRDRTIADQLTQGLAQGIASLRDPPQVLVDYLDYYENIPEWADYAMLAKQMLGPDSPRMESSRLPLTRMPGARVLLDAVALGSGFYVGANYPAVGQSLVATGTVTTSNRRVVQTARWAEETFETPNSLARFGVGIQSSAKVRLAHAFARRQVHASGHWDEDYYGKPISSFDNMVFLSGLLLLPDIVVASGAPVDRRWIELRRLQTRMVQYLLGAPRRLVTMPSDQMVRFFVMVVGHLDESPETARAVVESIRDGKHFRPTRNRQQHVERVMTLLIANMFVRRTWGNAMADRIGLPRWWMAMPVPWMTRIFFGWRPRMLKHIAKPYGRLLARSGASLRAIQASTTNTGVHYEGTAGVFGEDAEASSPDSTRHEP